MGAWDVVSQTPLGAGPQPGQPAQVPIQPVGSRNALTPRVLATVPPKPAAPKATYRVPTAQELDAYPGASQIDNYGKVYYPPAGVGGRPGNGGKLSPQDSIYLKNNRQSASEVSNMSNLMDEFVKMNKDVETGGLAAIPGVNSVMAPFDNKRSAMNAIVSRITPAMRNGLPGAASDRDVAMFKEATVGLDKPFKANQSIATSARSFAARQHDYVAYMEAYAKKNGNLLGAQEGWDNYTASNPVFEEKLDADGLPVPRKVAPWRSKFPELRPGAKAPSTGSDPLGLFK